MVKKSLFVLGLGNAIVDVIAKVSENFLDEWEIRKNSMTHIEEERAVERTEAVHGQELSGGGGQTRLSEFQVLEEAAHIVGIVKLLSAIQSRSKILLYNV